MKDWEKKAARNYGFVKSYYENLGGTQWDKIAADCSLFNRVWRKMLGLPTKKTVIDMRTGKEITVVDNSPPPKQYR